MKIYKRSNWLLIKNLLFAPIFAISIYVILSIFVEDELILWGVPSLLFLASIYLAIFSENIRIEVSDTGDFHYYKRNKLKKSYSLKGCSLGYRRKSEKSIFGSHELQLQISPMNTDDTIDYIDCSPLGLKQFEDMYAKMVALTEIQPDVLKAT